MSRIVAALLLCAAVVAASAAEAQIKVLAAPKDMVFTNDASRIPASDVAATIAHLSGVSSNLGGVSRDTVRILPVGHPIRKPVVSFMTVVSGSAPAAELEPTVATLTARIQPSATHAEQLSGLLTGSRSGALAFLDSVAAHQRDSHVISLSSSRSMLRASSVSQGFAGEKHISLYLNVADKTVEVSSGSSELATELAAAVNAALSVIDGGDRHAVEVVATVALVRALEARAEFGSDSAVDMVIFAFDVSPADSASFSGVLRDLAASVSVTYNGRAFVSALYLPEVELARVSSRSAAAKNARSGASVQAGVSLRACYETYDDCMLATNSCFSSYSVDNSTGVITDKIHGNCTLSFPASADPSNEYPDCFRCKCANGYTGENCEYFDVVGPFSTIVFTTVVLAVVAIGVSISLAQLDSGEDTILHRTAQRSKKTQ